MSVHIVDDEQRRDRARPPAALRVAAGRPRLLCHSSSTVRTGIACVAASCICPPDARAKVQPLFIDRPLVRGVPRFPTQEEHPKGLETITPDLLLLAGPLSPVTVSRTFATVRDRH
jgi:hypothetical protein